MPFSLDRVSLAYAGGPPTLDHLSLRAAAGACVAIIGPSGAGKTSLLRVLGAALRPQGGSVSLLGTQPWQAPAGDLRRLRARIGTVHQAPPLPPRQRVITAVQAGRLGQWPTLRALAALALPPDASGVRDTLARVDLADKLYARCDALSGGQLQRVGIARVLYQCPQLILADEPVSALDPALAQRTIALLVDEATRRGATLVASLHAVDLALAHFPRIVGLRDGRVAFDLPAGQVDDALLGALYASEGGQVPRFATDRQPPVPPGPALPPRCMA